MKQQGGGRDLRQLVVQREGCLRETGERFRPFVLLDEAGAEVEPVSMYLADLLAAGRSEATLRSYGNDLLRWFRFLAAVGVGWRQATRVEARDFCCWMIEARRPAQPLVAGAYSAGGAGGKGFQPATRAHSETALRQFYEFHLEMDTGPIINPFPLARGRRSERAYAHHNPLLPFRNERVGLYRPRVAKRIPRSIPDRDFDQIFAALPSHRDRAMVAFYISTAARASELLGARRCDVDEGQQLITVVRKGSRAQQRIPASVDAFVWLRLYQQQWKGQIPGGRSQPLWWTVRAPVRPLTYHGIHRMFERVNAALGQDWTLHSLRHSAAYRMASDPDMPLTDVQWVLGHADISSTQVYTVPREEDVIAEVIAHHARSAERKTRQRAPAPAPGYRADTLEVLFGRTLS